MKLIEEALLNAADPTETTEPTEQVVLTAEDEKDNLTFYLVIAGVVLILILCLTILGVRICLTK